MENGLPKAVDVGRIGLAIAPADPDVVYALVEAAGDESGFYASTDAGMSWEKRSDYSSGSPQYYQEIVVDPTRRRSRLLDGHLDAGDESTAGRASTRSARPAKHVDNHALWIDPGDTRHLRRRL